jgi:hypothetical protein
LQICQCSTKPPEAAVPLPVITVFNFGESSKEEAAQQPLSVAKKLPFRRSPNGPLDRSNSAWVFYRSPEIGDHGKATFVISSYQLAFYVDAASAQTNFGESTIPPN